MKAGSRCIVTILNGDDLSAASACGLVPLCFGFCRFVLFSPLHVAVGLFVGLYVLPSFDRPIDVCFHDDPYLCPKQSPVATISASSIPIGHYLCRIRVDQSCSTNHPCKHPHWTFILDLRRHPSILPHYDHNHNNIDDVTAVCTGNNHHEYYQCQRCLYR